MDKAGVANGAINCVILDLFSHLKMDIDFQKCDSHFEGKQVVLVVTSHQRPNLLRLCPQASFLLKPVTLHKCMEVFQSHKAERKSKLVLDKPAYCSDSHVLIVEGINQRVRQR